MKPLLVIHYFCSFPAVRKIVCASLLLVFAVPFRSFGDTIGALRAKAEALYDQGEYARSLDYYYRAHAASIEQGQPLWTANLLLDISAVVFISGDYRKCADLALEGVGLLEQQGTESDSTFFKLWSGLGQYYFRLSVMDSSFYYFGKADRLLEQQPALQRSIPLYVIFHYSNQALAHRGLGRYTQGIALASRALELSGVINDANSVGMLRNVLADLHENVGELTKAYGLRRDALADYRHNDIRKARIYSGLGRNALLRKDFQDAFINFKQAVLLQEELSGKDASQRNRSYLAHAYNGLANSLTGLKKYTEASDYLDKSLALYPDSSGKQNALAARSHLLKGEIAMASGNYEDAIRCYRAGWEALVIPGTTGPSAGHERTAIDVLEAMGRGFMAVSSYSRALEAFEQALDTYHTARQHLLELDDKLYLGEAILPLYRESLEAAYRVYTGRRDNATFDRAFRIAMQNQAVALRDNLAASGMRPAYLPPALTRREDSLRQELTVLQTAARVNPRISPSDQERLLTTQQAYFHFLQDLERAYPAYYNARYLPRNESPARLRAALDERTAWISFIYTHGKLHLFAFTKEEYSWKTMPLDSMQMNRTLQQLREALQMHPGITAYKGTTHALQAFDWFIRPLYGLIGTKKHWVVQAGGLLEGIPVEVLETGRSQGDYLALRHEVRYVYTVQSVVAPSKPVPAAPRVLAVAPFADTSDAAIRLGLSELPSSREEVEAITPLSYQSYRAGKQSVLAGLQGHGMLHLATHAVTDAEDPMRSYIAFYPEPMEQSRWYAQEISRSNLQHIRLTVLSACESGKGQQYPMEGVISLARCFAYAGCPTLVATLWSTQDKATTLLMRSFYGYLQEGASPSHALYRARIDFLQSDTGRRYNHPFFWANFVVIGEDAPVYPVSRGIHPGLYVTGLLGAGFLVVLAAVRFRAASRKRIPVHKVSSVQ